MIRDRTFDKTDSAATEVREVESHAGTLIALTKPRVNLMVVLTTFVGALFAASWPPDVIRLVATLGGTWALAAAAAVLNMVLERDVDALMNRTAARPVAARALSPRAATAFGVLLTVLGTAALALLTNALTAILGLVTLVLYLFAYTPLKRVTPWSTHVGAIPGALPPMMGWAAFAPSHSGVQSFAPAALGEQFWLLFSAQATIAWTLFGILFCWQLPHFFAIAWRHREDYARGGLAMLSVVEPTGRQCGLHAVVFAVVLLAVSVLPFVLALAGPFYLTMAVVCGLFFAWQAVRFLAERSQETARGLLHASLIYLPLVLTVLVLDRA